MSKMSEDQSIIKDLLSAVDSSSINEYDRAKAEEIICKMTQINYKEQLENSHDTLVEFGLWDDFIRISHKYTRFKPNTKFPQK